MTQKLSGDRYRLNQVYSPEKLLEYVEENKEQVDCLILLEDLELESLLQEFYERGILLPVIIISRNQEKLSVKDLYHGGEVILLNTELAEIASSIDRAITQYMKLGPSCKISLELEAQAEPEQAESKQTFLILQQRRLAEKLKERLGYLGVYYKRNPQSFYRNLSKEDKQELEKQLKSEYSQIIVNYFSENGTNINQAIDQFVNRAFFADISVSQILEMHMELIDEFAKQLKLEGRNEEILLDYRLTLIDLIAHLCEMYRRSIPREDLPFDLFLPRD
ncbi:MAG: circadian clock protein KaiA [Prochloraceae cyanobacterium]|nr:circadian clock protein KaiA [Prochloraceae cyanobacterium]